MNTTEQIPRLGHASNDDFHTAHRSNTSSSVMLWLSKWSPILGGYAAIVLAGIAINYYTPQFLSEFLAGGLILSCVLLLRALEISNK